MAEEKILKDELLSEEELDNVAGGKAWELQEDADYLRRYGLLGSGPVDKVQIEAAINRAGILNGISLGCDLHNGDKSNSYYINNEKYSHDGFWREIKRRYPLPKTY